MLDSAGVLHIRFLPGWIVVLGLSTFVVVLIVRRSLTAFDSVLLLATVGYGAAVTATRIAAAPETTVDTRFGLVAADFLIPVLFAHMPRLDRRRAVILVAGIVLIAVVNTSARHQANTTWGAAGTARRSLLNNAVALVRAGEPMVESRNLDLSGFGSGINQTRLQQLASAGLAIDTDGDRAWIRRARGELRMHVWPSGAVAGPPPAVSGDHRVSTAGCVRLKDGDRVAMDVAGPATISLAGSPEDEILLRWRDDLGYGDRSVPSGKLRHPFRPGYVTVALAAPPPRGAELEVHAVATTDGVAVCGLVADDAAPD
jgi:hypothetical protein